jgi:GNAT superfamily N-acetyltransferase
VTTAASDRGEVAVREMVPGDVPDAFRFSRASGWNQTEADWRFLLEENPRRFVVAVRDAVVVGTGGAACYGKRLAWVCMILVDAAERGRGIGSAIVTAVLDRVADMQTVGLDATPGGRAVYERLGFVAASALARVGGTAKDVSSAAGRVDTRPVEARDLETILTLDPEAFGADRSRTIRWAHEKAPALAWCVKDRNSIVGYSFGRQGDRAVHVGPVVAQDATMARALVARAAAAAAGRDLMLDVPTAAPGWAAALQDLGLREQRPFTRMYRAGSRPPGYPELTFAVFGPELG